MNRKYLVLCALFLGGCINLHNVFYITPNKPEQTGEIPTILVNPNNTLSYLNKEDVSQPLHVATGHKKQCPMWVPPKLPPAPRVPLDKLPINISKNDKEFHDIMISHIRDMHAYVKMVRDVEEDAYRKYQLECE